MKVFGKLKEEIVNAFAGGFTPKKIALSISTGIVFGTVPFCISTLLCTISGIILRLNQPLIQLINFMVFPLQILLFIPYLKFGEFLSGESTIPLNYNEVKILFSLPVKLFILKLGKAIIYALIGWLFLSPLIFLLSYYLSFYLLIKFRNFNPKFKK